MIQTEDGLKCPECGRFMWVKTVSVENDIVIYRVWCGVGGGHVFAGKYPVHNVVFFNHVVTQKTLERDFVQEAQ